MSSVYSRGSSAGHRSYLNTSNPEQRKRQQCGLLLATIFIITVIIAVSLTIVNIYEAPSASDKATTPPTNVVAPAPSTPVAGEGPTAPTPIPTEAPTITGYQACNGYENLCDIRANLVFYATLHNAVSSSEDGVSIVPNHQLQLEGALASGWRGLNFDIGKCSEFTDQPIRLVHGICSLGTRDPIEVFTNIQAFLESKPNEVIIMPVQIDNSLDGGAITFTEIFDIMDQVPGFTSLLYQHSGFGTPWPTLRELIASNTRILFFLYNGDTLCVDAADGCPAGFHDWFIYAAETAFEFDTVDDLITDTNTSCAITRGGQGVRDFFGINYFTRIPSTSVCEEIHVAATVKTHVDTCSDLNAQIPPSLIITDYWNIGNVVDVVSVHNEQLSGEATTRSRQLFANVTMDFLGTFSTTMDDTVQSAFLSTCSDYYNTQLSEFSDVYCTGVFDQTIVPPGRREQRRQQRHLQSDGSTLQVTVEVRAGDPTDSNATSLTTADLETTLETTSSTFVQSLSQESDYFFTVTGVRVTIDGVPVTIAPTETPSSTSSSVPSSTPSTVPTSQKQSSSPTIGRTNAPSTTPPVLSTLAPMSTVAPSITPVKAPVVATITPVVLTPQQPFLCNGHVNLCDRAVNDILFATVHNAASTSADGVFIFPNHDQNLEAALISGYRGINLDVGKCDDALRLVHGFCALGYREVIPTFTNIVTFLQGNSNEVIIMPIQIDSDVGGTVTLQEIDAIIQQVPGMKELMYNHPGDASSWPTLRELIAANTRILFFVYNGERCYGTEATVSCPIGIHDWFQYTGESEFQFNRPAQLINDKAYACAISRGGSGRLDFYGVNVFTTIPSDRSCEILNAAENLVSHLSSCSTLTGQTIVNLLIVDCWDIGDVISVTNNYNAAL